MQIIRNRCRIIRDKADLIVADHIPVGVLHPVPFQNSKIWNALSRPASQRCQIIQGIHWNPVKRSIGKIRKETGYLKQIEMVSVP